MKPKKIRRVLDLYCAAGGASEGLHRVFKGAEITGVDIESQPHYPFKFIRADALKFDLSGYDFIWASPPCQKHSTMTKRWGPERVDSHSDLIALTRDRLKATSAFWVIENVIGAPLVNPTMLCGTMFKLHTDSGNQLRRHRLFEMPWYLGPQPRCAHNTKRTIGVWGNSGGSSKRDGISFFSTADRRKAMGINWMVGLELSQAIPPAYAEWVAEMCLQQTPTEDE